MTQDDHIPESILKLKETIKKGRSVVSIGFSVARKSSLVYTGCNENILKTAESTSSTSKWNHSSTLSEMVLMKMKGPAILMHTPIVRELRITIKGQRHIADFLDISSSSRHFHFKNFEHINETGYVLDSIENGD
ncbi:hypothetical protein SMI01S_07400 [Sphingobacterium mizutaii NBRC 14946 = DSM 11724]|uniref:Uncharacterized protein n=1 Tax=Sphingobacterium mizutaii NBRC 14946 = DSM 11724 TaxID=1220576 RepID=A0ABQ0VZS6_9SPHI|nr:hypothetical protein [Sphingobacterium mizutaii]GEM67134.1 hypothetical protein SMI01S_07400 [Sphingobacterium mizutaii NBRC 14946 = DSM 11724]